MALNRRKCEACTEPGCADRSDGKNGAERAGAGHVVCDGRPRLVLEGGSVGDVQALRFVVHGCNFAPDASADSPADARLVVRLALPPEALRGVRCSKRSFDEEVCRVRTHCDIRERSRQDR